MKTIVIPLLVIAIQYGSRAAAFQNLDFDQANTNNVVPYQGGQFGGTGAVGDLLPGWKLYASGATNVIQETTMFFNGGLPGVGSYGWAALGSVNQNLPSRVFHSPPYSLSLEPAFEIDLVQVGHVPADVRSIRFISSGNVFSLQMSGTPVPLTYSQLYPGYNESPTYQAVGDISAFAGGTFEMRLIVGNLHGGTIDSIEFISVPEPSTGILLLLGGGMVWTVRRKCPDLLAILKKPLVLCFLCFAVPMSLCAAPFVNLGFDDANTNNLVTVGGGSNSTRYGTPADLVPGWSIASFGTVFYDSAGGISPAPLGDVSLYTSTNIPVASGAIAQYLSAPYAISLSPIFTLGSPMLFPGQLLQRGDVPASTMAITFLVFGSPVDLYINGVRRLDLSYQSIATVGSQTLSRGTADMTSFAGLNVELKFVTTDTSSSSIFSVIDSIQFVSVPEPGVSALFVLGGTTWWLIWQRQRRWAEPFLGRWCLGKDSNLGPID